MFSSNKYITVISFLFYHINTSVGFNMFSNRRTFLSNIVMMSKYNEIANFYVPNLYNNNYTSIESNSINSENKKIYINSQDNQNTENDKKLIDEYIENLNEVFLLINKCEQGDLNIDTLLESNVCHSEFTRLN